MKIVVLGLRGVPNILGGVEGCCEHIYPHINKAGHEVIILGRSCYIGNKPYFYEGIKIIPLWTPRLKSLEAIIHTFIATLYAFFLKPDLIHFQAIGPSLFVPLAKFFRMKVLATHHGFDYDRQKWGKIARLVLRLGEKGLCKADKVVVIAKYIQESLQERFKKKSTLIFNGTSLKEILPPGDIVKKYELESKKYFLFTGRFVPEKCLHILLDAFDKIETDWKLVIAGDADHPTPYSEEIKSRGKKLKNVVLTGFISGRELQEIYSNAGCAVLPSTHEGLPLSLIEALGYGLPAIISNIPAHLELSHSNINLFPVNNVEVLRDLMQKTVNKTLVQNPERSREYIKNNFNWEHQAKELLTLYQDFQNYEQ